HQTERAMQIFHPSTNSISKVTIFGAIFIIAACFVALWVYVRSPYVTGAGVVREQPVPFSHKHHVTDDGIDCRYCHTGVENSSFAGLPSTQICMNCHSQLYVDSPMLAPVRDSYINGTPLQWARVNNLPDYVYFDHSIHVNKGVGCNTCHGQINEMPLTWQSASLYMEWCLQCHRNPAQYVRPRDQVFNMNYQSPPDQLALGEQLVADYHIDSKTSCSTCHR
ncbi:MAG: cytochrome c3 family protein, partial [Caldilineaceae bacterium]|nr:cytochrome c3 family protein [Caldilineaceae bacterium]